MKKGVTVVALGVGATTAYRWYPELVRVIRSTVILNNVDISSVIQPKKGGEHEMHAPPDAGVT